ncbi:hypothetical protein HS088_TW09G00714 [Tripterygium wilfordii]|uniref:Uncharacterized protein n=1 Tax=Tripterygium wilfordii TaxID=458696 RepID=A0A7J7D8K4_TRIWF|nr:hypothetical protein HS088_TW09G00714 [Tripterygium wilfordii]
MGKVEDDDMDYEAAMEDDEASFDEEPNFGEDEELISLTLTQPRPKARRHREPRERPTAGEQPLLFLYVSWFTGTQASNATRNLIPCTHKHRGVVDGHHKACSRSVYRKHGDWAHLVIESGVDLRNL